MKIEKICGCGKEHKEIPKNAREWKEDGIFIGWFWECECKSTLFVSALKLEKEVA